MNQHRRVNHTKKVVVGLMAAGAVATTAGVLTNSAQAAREGSGDGGTRPAGAQTASFLPVVDVSNGAVLDLAATARKSGVKHFTLGHIQRGSGCTTEDQDKAFTGLEKLRRAGGAVQVSFGGDGGDLTPACSSAERQAAAYAKVIDTHKLNEADFDVQGFVLNMPDLNARRSQAIARLQKDHPGLRVSFSLPVVSSGLTPNGVKVLTAAKAKGVDISMVNLVTGNPGAGATGPDLLKYTTGAANAAHRQISAALGLPAAKAWQSIAVTPRIGANDFGERTFTPRDAKGLVAFARSRHLGRLSMDSINRDKQCRDSVTDTQCSGVRQKPFAFSKALGSYESR
ncbi:chitinase [Streptomyces sp. NPDC101110]|uniref:chitinase n=1 Tax=Streptomyces sp. NPDC101110 TaxID=3366104 RepID=UPI0038022C29